MVAATRVKMSDISRQKRFETDLSGRLTPHHTVGQAVEHYLDEMQIDDQGVRWSVFTRGLKLDNKQQLSDLPEADTERTVMPEVSAFDSEGKPFQLSSTRGKHTVIVFGCLT